MRSNIERKIIIIIILFIIAALVYLKLDEKEGNKKEEVLVERNEYIRTVKGVSMEMLSAKYWLSREEKADEIIMSPMEIELWNEEFIKTKFYEASEVKNTYSYGYTVNRASIRKEPSGNIEELLDELQVSSILMNEPVVVESESEDGEWYYIRCRYCEGWIEKKNVALCKSFAEWEEKLKMEDFLLITGNKEVIDVDEGNGKSNELIVYMGTKLELVRYEDYENESANEDRIPFECYIVKVPIRNEVGELSYKYGFVPISKEVNVGFLPYTKENLVTQMFKAQGDRYGWGGMFASRDCSGYVMDIYSLFGFEFARNSAAQIDMPFDGYDVSELSENEKKKILDDVPIGSLLYFEGHIMLYLGEVEGEYYVISETARIMEDNIVNAHSCMITPLSVKRPNSDSWLNNISNIKIIKK